MKINRLAIIANAQKTGEKGGAERFFALLAEAFRTYVDRVDLVPVDCSEATFEDILKGYLACYDLDLSEYDGVVSTKAPTFAVRHENHVCYLVHTVRVFYDRFDEISADPANAGKRGLLLRMDRELLSPPHIKKLYTIGHEVSERSKKYTGVESEVLHPGITREGFRCDSYGDYLFMPGRLHRWKRVDLVIRAMKYVRSPIRLKIAGKGEQEAELRELAGNDERIAFLGFVSDEEMTELYANALAVAFTPIDEDYGYILHEAFKSEKAVITCTDSGEPARFIRQGKNGYAVEPKPRKIAEKIDLIWENREHTIEMGRCGKADIENITWDRVVRELLRELEA